MYLSLRQICLVARDKAQTVSDLDQVLDLRPVHGSGDLSPYGLPAKGPMSDGGRALLAAQGIENLIFAAGRDFIEVLFPLREDATSERYRQRRGGDTGYMLVLQTDDIAPFADRARLEGVRIVHEASFPHYADIHLHTKDTGGTLLSMARHLPDNVAAGAWYPAGQAWETQPGSSRVSGLTAVEIQSEDPQLLAERWARLLGLTTTVTARGHRIDLDDGEIRFVSATDGRGEGLSGLDLRVSDLPAVRAAADRAGLTLEDDVLMICGMRCALVA
jgi:hypothetical protein